MTGRPSASTPGPSLRLVAAAALALAACAWAAGGSPLTAAPGLPAWVWALIMFIFCCATGVVAVIAGVGGGVLFVPLVGTFFPFHMDFVRGTALFVALAGALSASARFLRQGTTFPRLVLPFSLASSVGAIAGAMVGLALPEDVVRILLGLVIGGVCAVMVLTRGSAPGDPDLSDPIAAALEIEGVCRDSGREVTWRPRRMVLTIALFVAIGFVAGVFGLGAGWASVPVLHLVAGVPLKAAVASSLMVISISNTPPSLVYLNSGAVLPALAVPSVIGMMLGSRLGSKLVTRLPSHAVRWFVIALLAVAGLLSLLKGLGAL